jgi:hypothetical protein
MSQSQPTNAYPAMEVTSMNGSSPANAALNNTNATSQQMVDMNKALAGGRKRRHIYYGGAQPLQPAPVVVPQANMAYTDQSVPGINGPNGTIATLAKTQNQAAANSAMDGKASTGGSRRRRRGRKSKKSKKSRKSRKSRNSRKLRR